MRTSTAPFTSVAAELDAWIAEADAADARWASLQDRIEAQIARLERMNPAQVAAMTAFADLSLEAAA